MLSKSKLWFIVGLALIPFLSFAQISGEYSIKIRAKISNQGSGKPGFKDWNEYATRTLKTLEGYTAKKIKLNKYGGRADKKVKATGFYYATNLNGRWWSVDPLGNLFVGKGVNSVQVGASDRNKAAFEKKFTDTNNWAEKTTEMLRQNGFNVTGAWSNYSDLRKVASQPALAYTVMLDFMGSYGRKKGAYQQSGHLGYPDNTIFVFDPEFETYANEYAKQIAANAGDKNLYGYFSDNEMPFNRLTLDKYLAKKDTADAGRLAAVAWLKQKGISQADINDQIRNEFLGYAVDKYFSIVSKAIRQNDPNHMYIGCRFHAYEKNVQEVFKAAGKYLDAVSVNYYNEWTPQAKHLDNWVEWSGKPVIITEWYVKGEDSGMGNYSGAGWLVKTQEERGLFYQNFTLGLLEGGKCVGWHWFKYQDNDPANKKVDPSNTDANKGILNNDYELYKPLVSKMKELNESVYSLIDFFDKRRK